VDVSTFFRRRGEPERGSPIEDKPKKGRGFGEKNKK